MYKSVEHSLTGRQQKNMAFTFYNMEELNKMRWRLWIHSERKKRQLMVHNDKDIHCDICEDHITRF